MQIGPGQAEVVHAFELKGILHAALGRRDLQAAFNDKTIERSPALLIGLDPQIFADRLGDKERRGTRIEDEVVWSLAIDLGPYQDVQGVGQAKRKSRTSWLLSSARQHGPAAREKSPGPIDNDRILMGSALFCGRTGRWSTNDARMSHYIGQRAVAGTKKQTAHVSRERGPTRLLQKVGPASRAGPWPPKVPLGSRHLLWNTLSARCRAAAPGLFFLRWLEQRPDSSRRVGRHSQEDEAHLVRRLLAKADIFRGLFGLLGFLLLLS